MKKFSMNFTVCYADTDAGGVVYHSRYIDIAERARMEMLHDMGVTCRGMLAAEKPVGMMVRRIEIDYKLPAFLEDVLTVETELLEIGGATFDLLQTIKRSDDIIAQLKVYVFTVSGIGKPTRVPSYIREKWV